MRQTQWAFLWTTALAAVVMLGVADCSRQAPGPYTKYEGMPPDATVEMNEVQSAYIGNAGGGSGTLFYRGRVYPFSIAGLGVGGIGASTIDAAGDVYNLPNVYSFAGSYAQGSTGFVIGNMSRGDLSSERQRRRHAP